MCLFGHFSTGGRYSKRGKYNKISRKWEMDWETRDEKVRKLCQNKFWQTHCSFGRVGYEFYDYASLFAQYSVAQLYNRPGKIPGNKSLWFSVSVPESLWELFSTRHLILSGISQVNSHKVMCVICRNLALIALCHSLSEHWLHCTCNWVSE